MTDRRIVMGVDELRGSYFAIAVDPPWPVKKIPRKVRPRQKAELDYRTMTLDQIAAIPISDLCHPEGAYCYLWTTHKFYHKAYNILEGWGFEHPSAMMWLKKTGMTPFGLVQLDSEPVVYGVRGDPPIKRFDVLPHHRGEQVAGLAFTGVSRRHSEKPREFYEIVRLVHPAPRLNLFARKPHQGFDNWGDQVEAEQPRQTTILEEPELDWRLYPRESAAPLSPAGMALHHNLPPPYGGRFHCPTKVMSMWKWGAGKDKNELPAYIKKVFQARGEDVEVLQVGRGFVQPGRPDQRARGERGREASRQEWELFFKVMAEHEIDPPTYPDWIVRYYDSPEDFMENWPPRTGRSATRKAFEQEAVRRLASKGLRREVRVLEDKK